MADQQPHSSSDFSIQKSHDRSPCSSGPPTPGINGSSTPKPRLSSVDVDDLSSFSALSISDTSSQSSGNHYSSHWSASSRISTSSTRATPTPEPEAREAEDARLQAAAQKRADDEDYQRAARHHGPAMPPLTKVEGTGMLEKDKDGFLVERSRWAPV